MKTVRKIAILMIVLALLLCGCQKTPSDVTPPDVTPSDVAIGTIKTADFSIDYCEFGSGDRTLVILPGLSIQNVLGSADAIAEAYQLLTDEFTVYVFERRQDLPSPYTVSDMAEDTAVAFRALGLEKISIMGASYGGMAALEIALHHPDLVENVILASTSANLTEEEYQTVANWVQLAKAGNAEDLYLAFGEAVYPEEVYEQSRDLLINAAKTVTEEDLKKFIILAEGMKGFNISNELDQIKCPVLAIGDRQDKVLGPEATENIALYMKQHSSFELYMYDGYGHAVYDLAPDFKERMLNFLTQH